MVKQKINIKERLSNGEIDLSMSELEDVPVKDIATFKKATSLDVSNNHLRTLPSNFATLTHLTKLDLSKNDLAELPENFGDLVKLKNLDLYRNKLEFLPLSFSKLRALKWLDLKDNPLAPAVAKVAGPCLDTQQCQSCAKDIVNFYALVQEQVNAELESKEKERQKQLEASEPKPVESKKKKNKAQREQEEVARLHRIYAEDLPPPPKTPLTPAKVEQRKLSFRRWTKIYAVFAVVFCICYVLMTLTAFKFRYTVILEEVCVDLFNRVVAVLPPFLQKIAEEIGDYLRSAQESSKRFLEDLVSGFHEEVNYIVHGYEYVCGFISAVFYVIGDLYTTYVF